jgi:hypothetical protein
MKKSLYILLSFIFSLSVFAGNVDHAPLSEKEIKIMTKHERTDRYKELKSKVKEIKKLPLEDFSESEKQDVRQTLHSIKGEMETLDSEGIYISGTAIIIIILLILLL